MYISPHWLAVLHQRIAIQNFLPRPPMLKNKPGNLSHAPWYNMLADVEILHQLKCNQGLAWARAEYSMPFSSFVRIWKRFLGLWFKVWLQFSSRILQQIFQDRYYEKSSTLGPSLYDNCALVQAFLLEHKAFSRNRSMRFAISCLQVQYESTERHREFPHQTVLLRWLSPLSPWTDTHDGHFDL